jgi:PAS domain S-box-containing protein
VRNTNKNWKYLSGVAKYYLVLVVAWMLPFWACPAFGNSLSAAELAWLEDNGEIVFVSQNSYPPFEFKDSEGNHQGMCIELARWMSTELGFKASFRDMTFIEAQDAILSGEADVLTSLFYSNERDMRFDFSGMTWEVPALIFISAERTDITRLKDLQGKRIAMQRGDYAAEFLKSRGIECEFLLTSTFAEATDCVIEGDADAVIGDQQIVFYHLFSNGLADRVKSVGEPLYIGRNCMGVREGRRELVSILNKGIALAHEQGVFENITRKWVGTQYTRPEPWQHEYTWHLIIALVVVFIFAAIVVISSIRFRQIVARQTHQLLDNAGDVIFLFGLDGRFVFVNEQACRTLGYVRSELLALYVWDVEVGWNREYLDDLLRELNTNLPEMHEGTHRRKDSSTFPVELRIDPFQWKGSDLIFVLARDITRRKQAEAVILQRGRYLTGLNDAAKVLLIPAYSVPFQDFVDKIGPTSEASRVYVFINHSAPDGGLLMSQKAEWCAEGITPEIDNPFLQNLSYDKWLPRWKDTFLRGDIIKGRVKDFPDKEREILESEDIQAILIIPIIVDNELYGFIGFDNCVSEQEWSAVSQTFLRTAASHLAQSIKRTHSDEMVRASLREKEVLLREIHHRVKNNMQVIVSLLRMHSRRIDDTRLRHVFDECRDRVNAMSLIHEALYQSEDLARIDLEVYIRKLGRNLSQVYGASGRGIVLKVEHGSVTLGMDQGIAVGMVICELVSNAFKYAFPAGKGGIVTVSLMELEGNQAELIVQDNGKGLPPEIDIMNSPSLGLDLAVATVVGELGGSIDVERDSGTRFIIHFKCSRT